MNYNSETIPLVFRGVNKTVQGNWQQASDEVWAMVNYFAPIFFVIANLFLWFSINGKGSKHL